MKRCDEMLRQLRFFGDIMNKYNVTPIPRAGREKEYHLNELEVRLLEGEEARRTPCSPTWITKGRSGGSLGG